MAKRRFQGWGKPYYSGSWKVRFYEPGAISTFRLTKVSEKKR